MNHFVSGKWESLKIVPAVTGELVVTILAIVERLFGFQFDSIHLAARTAHAFGPAQLSQNLAALFVSRKQSVYIN